MNSRLSFFKASGPRAAQEQDEAQGQGVRFTDKIDAALSFLLTTPVEFHYSFLALTGWCCRGRT